MDARVKPGHDDCDMRCSGGVVRLREHAHDVGFLHDQELFAVELDLGARPLAEQHAIAGLDVDRNELAGLVAPTGADCDNLTLLGFFLGAVRNDNAALGLFLGVDTFDHDTVMQRTKFGFSHDSSFWRLRFQVWFRSGVPSKVDRNTGVFDTAKSRTRAEQGPDSSYP